MDRDLLETLKAFADPSRLRVIGALARAESTLPELTDATGLAAAVINRHLGTLRRAGLAVDRPTPRGPAWALRVGAINDVGRRLAALERGAVDADEPPLTGPDGEPLPAEEAKILRSFLEDGRLTTIPAQERKRLVVLRYLREVVFTEDRAYPEKEVNQRLALFHRDVASLRRYMVDCGLVTRAGGEYRRA